MLNNTEIEYTAPPCHLQIIIKSNKIDRNLIEVLFKLSTLSKQNNFNSTHNDHQIHED